MQPYSELANWDGSLSDVVVDSLTPPSPSNTPPLPMYDQYHNNQSNQQTNLLSSSSNFGGTSNTHFPNAPQDSLASSSSPSSSSSLSSPAVVPDLSPQEREIMADITLDPDDLEPSRHGVASSVVVASTSTASSSAWAWAALAPETPAVKMDDNDASMAAAVAPAATQSRLPVAAPAPSTTAPRYPMVPAPPAVSISTSVSPSPFAPPPTSAPIAGLVSHPLPLPSSSSSSSHVAVKAKLPDDVRVHPDQLAHSSDLDADGHPTGTEHVMERTFPSASRPDAGEATAGRLDAFTHDPLDQPQPRAPSRQSPVLPPLDTINHSSSSRSPRRSPKTPLFLPSPSESVPPSHPLSDPLLPEESDVISINSSSSSSSSSSLSPPPLRRLRRHDAQKLKVNKQGRQLMSYVLIPPLPSGARKSNNVPLEKALRLRKHRVTAKNRAAIGDNASSSALVAALRGAFENNSIGAGSMKTARARRKRGKTKAVVPVEVVEVVDDADVGEDKGELRSKGSNNLARALSSAFAHNSADPNVGARSATLANGRTHKLRRRTHAEVSNGGSANVEVIVPPKRSRPPLRTRVISDTDDSNTLTSRRRNEKRQPQTPTSPQKKKRRRLARREGGNDVDEHNGEEKEEEEIEIVVNHASRELPRRASETKPHSSTSKAERSKLSRSRRGRASSMPSPTPISARTSLPSPSPSPSPPLESPTASPPDTNSLTGLPLTILPAPAASDIVIPPRALSHLHPLPGPLDETRHRESVQGFHCEESAVGAHGLLESPSVVAAISSAVTTTTTTTATTIDSSIRANPAGLQNPPVDLGLDVVVPMAVTDREQERQDAVQAAVMPSHALRISSSTHPDGPMLGFMLSEHDDARRTTSLSADTEVSSDVIGLEHGAKTTSDMEFMLLDSMDHNSAFNADAGWVDWHATAPSSGLIVENEFVGDGTINPAVLGGAECSGASLGGGIPNKAVFRSDDYIRSHRSSLMPASDNANNHDSDDLGDEGDVMGLLFENSTDSGVSRPPSAHAIGGKGKNKDTSTVGLADANSASRGGTRKRRKSWRKALADDNDIYEATDTESNDTATRPYLSNVSNKPSSSVTATFCHHCRCKTFRPKMRCTLIKESTGKPCGKMYCDSCIQKRYPSLTFDEFATSFSCPCCGKFCNCTHCARARGETYIPERNGGWRRWAAMFPVVAAAATSGSTSPSRKEASRDGTRAKVATAQDLEADNAMPIVPDEPEPTAVTPLPPPPPPPPPPHSTSNTLNSSHHLHVPIPTTSTAATESVVDKKRRRHAYIGKWQKSWGRLVSAPDPDPDPELGRNGRRRKRAVRVRLFVGSKEPLLLSRNRTNKRDRKNPKRGRGREKGLKVEKNEQRQVASSLPPLSQSSTAARDEGGTNQNVALYGEHDSDPDAGAENDKGIWPGEYGQAHAHYEHITFVPPGVTVSGVVAASISPEELERAIGAAFAAGMQF